MQLVVTEKPSVAQAISHVIGAKERKDGYMEGNGFLVSWCVGHLVELAQPEMYSEAWKKWSYESLPMIPEQWQHEVKKETATQYKILKNLMHDTRVESVVCATDAGREGELIFRLVYEQAGCRKPVKRLWISSLEEKAIREGFQNLKAVKNKNVFLMDGNAYLTRPGPRIVDGIEILAEILYPKAFPRKFNGEDWQSIFRG